MFTVTSTDLHVHNDPQVCPQCSPMYSMISTDLGLCPGLALPAGAGLKEICTLMYTMISTDLGRCPDLALPAGGEGCCVH